MSVEIRTTSPDETLALGRRFAALLTAGDIVVLAGRLGSGKTLFASGVASGLGIREQITSPTFLIEKVYRDGFLPLIHADMYRLSSIGEFEDLELADEGRDGAVLIEWGDTIEDSLPADRLVIRFDIDGDGDERVISFTPHGTWADRDLEVLV
ncbi:MAG: tRNA (adenosine(37)-N6)-threonylcarbamoyltransferase complex ATPase subunit type 1 TsaE [Actinomycetota bacterium]|nr:tRNA (adenosine(37)-N6)-threonylcarbamoyltransferase complex ATPase subunit type 1 TsaE [Actinomycetota bacterium]MDK1016254.1 tRNA (adenosine(37)-N6)-threonylcarbamoyltransferase complex ATPase subunit type 1 TsaE [Actinomycetota bacterium]MDK1026010.1 tRNA (adenosine(37)-N6)-threonylcarbamoyltransferase complex ATPase subunit type 1 TsaE [Actinomycetota bacterium]MDK1037878.1 tRNA (adenosine(37)-N6)-threonylcarbamoyltransferase complex ATPase subunit type 1 TsaE [Actinomycetota bacterium]M